MSELLFKLRCQIGEYKARTLRWLGLKGGDWRTGLADESQFWAEALANGGEKWDRSEFDTRTNPQLELQSELRALINAPDGATVRILDVGSGPLTRLGKIWEGRSVEITAVDPLAEDYKKILQELEIPVSVVPSFAEAERLREVFQADTFDLAYASNCLDHSYSPLTAIKEMLAVVKPGRWVYLWHFIDAGIQERYQGLHQWNFGERDGDMTVNDGRRHFSLQKELDGFGEVQTRRERAFDSPVVIAQIRKLSTPPKI